MNIVVTMAGSGERFRDQGFTRPKPLIEVHGEPMYSAVARCLPLDLASRIIFVCLAEHLDTYPLANDIDERFGHLGAEIVALEGVTAGQAVTAWAAEPKLDLGKPLLIHNADTLFRSDLPAVMQRYPGASGILGVFEAEGDHWSFARVDENDRVVETAEKVRISALASTGLYQFASAVEFGSMVEGAVGTHSEGDPEIYIAPLYNQIIDAGGEVRVDRARWVSPLGTPAELATYLEASSR